MFFFLTQMSDINSGREKLDKETIIRISSDFHVNTCRRAKIRVPGRINFWSVLEPWLRSSIDSIRKGRDEQDERAWKQRTRAARSLSLTQEFFIKLTYIRVDCGVARSGGIDLFLIMRATLCTYRRIGNVGSFVR